MLLLLLLLRPMSPVKPGVPPGNREAPQRAQTQISLASPQKISRGRFPAESVLREKIPRGVSSGENSSERDYRGWFPAESFPWDVPRCEFSVPRRIPRGG